MTALPILAPPRREWWCPRCTLTSVTERAGLHVEMHTCAGLRGVWAPMFERGERGHLVVVERDDYAGRDKVTMFDGRPVMRVEKWVGGHQRDVTIFLPSAQRRLTVDEVADVLPRDVRRKGSVAMRDFVVRSFRALTAKERPHGRRS